MRDFRGHACTIRRRNTRSQISKQLITEMDFKDQIIIDPMKYTWMEHSWWTNTLTSIQRYNIKIIGQVQMLNLWVENDSFIMEN